MKFVIVSTLLSTLNQLISLVHARKEHKKDVFSTFVEPLYSGTESVISNYLQLYLNVIEAIRKGESQRKAYFDFLSEFRDDSADNVDEDQRSQESFSHNGISPPLIYDRFQAERQASYHVRAKLMEIAEVYSNSKLDDDIKEFAASIASVFKMVTDKHRRLTEPRSVIVARTLQEKETESSKRIELLENVIREIRSSWEEATRRYAQLQLKSKRLV